MSLKQYTAQGYEAFQETLKSIGAGKRIVALFTGSKSLITGQSWCPDCVVADPIIEKVINSQEIQSLDVHFIIVFVGNREVWKSPDSPFRTDPKLKLTCIPTLLEVNQKAKRLLDSQVANANLVHDFLADEE
ncbi:unnamed protein product [Caenorhabditis angaria]|uniref:Thioredoxin domain-containing protein 17 n=1 Tax=Caenorhabditis angaria TaxID=860376 RepID=A0A9P1IH31_9PELO|nr:unnamed protein product [Caenorhabditis angaria]